MLRLLTYCCFLLIFQVGFSQSIEKREAEALKIKNTRKRIDALNTCLEYCWQSGEYQKGLQVGKRTVRLAHTLNYPEGEGVALNHVGIINDYLGNYAEALKNYFTALTILEKTGSKKQIAFTYSNIGLLYSVQERYGEALEYHRKSLRIREELKDIFGLSACHNNLGIVYMELKQFDKALFHYRQSVALDHKINSKRGLGDTYNNIGLVYVDTKKYDSALYYFDLAEKYRLIAGDVVGQGTEWVNKGITYMKMGDNATAKKYFAKVTPLAEKHQAISLAEFAEKNVAIILEDEGNYKEALAHFKKKVAISQQLNNDDVTRRQTETEMQYAFNKETTRRKLEQARRDFQAQKARELTQIILWSVVGLFIIAGAAAFTIFRRWKITKAQKVVIEEKNALVEAKNREILDSINYAKRIQKALLPSDKQLNHIFPEHFVFYRPKDIVAGDFYWLEAKDDLVFFAVGDCTGHGVPGALVSIVCINALNKSILEYRLTDPAAILEKTRAIVLEEFDRTEDQVNDGMDISLICWNRKTSQISFSGANNHLWVVSNGTLRELRASKQPIGVYHRYLNFETQSVQLDGGETLYFYTDGFADQFGYANGKKFKSSRLKEELVRISSLSTDLQCRELEAVFDRWKGSEEQIDDVCIAGIHFV